MNIRDEIDKQVFKKMHNSKLRKNQKDYFINRIYI